MRICFIGAGALGSTIGGTLARGGAEVFLIDPFQAHVDAINATGLRMLEGDAAYRAYCSRVAWHLVPGVF